MFNQMPYMMPYANLSNTAPIAGAVANAGSKASLLGKINWASLLTNAQKTLNVVNQAIPLYYQVKPVFNNIKTLGKIGKELSNTNNVNNISDTNVATNNNTEIKLKQTSNSNLSSDESLNPTFFL